MEGTGEQATKTLREGVNGSLKQVGLPEAVDPGAGSALKNIEDIVGPLVYGEGSDTYVRTGKGNTMMALAGIRSRLKRLRLWK